MVGFAIIAVQIFIHDSISNAQPSLKLAIGFVRSGPSTSTSNPIEDHIRKGVELAMAMTLSKQIETVWIDQGETAEQTLSAIDMINRVRPLIAVGMGHSFQALLAADRIDLSTVLIFPVATSDEILRRSAHVLMLSNANSTQARLLGDEIHHSMLPGQRILVIEVAGCPYCVDLAEAICDELSQKKLEPVKARVHLQQIADQPDDLKSLRGFDQIVLPVLEPEAARLIEILRPNNRSAVFWGGDGWGTLARFVRELPYVKSLKVYWLSHYYEGIDSKENREFVRRFRVAYGVGPVDTSALYFESVRMALRLEVQKSSSQVLAAFRRLGSYQGVTGRVEIIGNHVERAMPLMTLSDGQVRMQRLLFPGKRR